MPAYQQNDVFPSENELGFIADDPSGDNLDPDSPNLNITLQLFIFMSLPLSTPKLF